MDLVLLTGIVVTAISIIPVVWQLRSHPRGLPILFFVEMWERFAYYGMRGLLIFYMTQHFLFDDGVAQRQYGAYTSLVYLLPLIGGLLADRYLGTRKAIAFGAILLVLGHFTMGIEGKPAQQILVHQGQEYVFDVKGRMEAREVGLIVDGQKYAYGASADGGLEIKGLPEGASLPSVLPKGSFELEVKRDSEIYTHIFFLALALILMGVGFLKANISTIVGQLYEKGDPRRDSGFTLYYYGINLGAFWAAIACGWLGTNIGWWAGFGAAGVGMSLGFLVFGLGKLWLDGKGEPPNPELLKKSVLGPINVEWFIYLLGFAGVAFVWIVVQRNEAVGYMMAGGSFLVLAYLLVFMITQCTFVEAQRLILAIILIGASTVFWTLFEQAGSSLNQFAERNTMLTAGEVSITAAETQSFNGGFILLLTPLFALLWAYLGRFNLDPNPALKFGLALVQVGAGFFVLVWGAQFADASFRVPLIFLVLTYFLHTTGELFISPVGLSQMTRLAPAAVASTIMATWYLASSWAQYLGGMVAELTAAETVAGQVLDPAKALQTYVEVFSFIGWWGIAAGVVLIVASPALRWLAGDGPAQRGDFFAFGSSVAAATRSSGQAIRRIAGWLWRAAPASVALGAFALLLIAWPSLTKAPITLDAASAAVGLTRDGAIIFNHGDRGTFVRSIDDGYGTYSGDTIGVPAAAHVDTSGHLVVVDESGFVRRTRVQKMFPDVGFGPKLARGPEAQRASEPMTPLQQLKIRIATLPQTSSPDSVAALETEAARLLRSLWREGRYDDILGLALPLQARNPASGTALYFAAEAYRGLGDVAGTKAYIDRYLELAETNAEAQNGDASLCYLRATGLCGERTGWVFHLRATIALREADRESNAEKRAELLTEAFEYEKRNLMIQKWPGELRNQGYRGQGQVPSSCDVLQRVIDQLAGMNRNADDVVAFRNSQLSCAK